MFCDTKDLRLLSDDDIEIINKRYNKRIEQYGYGIESLASGTQERRELRFKVITEIGLKSGMSILDVGCGLADYYAYLKNLDLKVEYTGIDINPNLIAKCQEIYPAARFLVSNIEKDDLGRFDYVISSSAFNLKIDGKSNMELIESVISRMYKHASKGVAIDMLTKWVDFRGNDKEAFYYDPTEVFSIAKRITKRVTLRHDYQLFEFCLYMFPDFEGWAQH